DRDPEAIRRVSDSLDVQTVEGSGSSPVVLEEAGIQDAEIILAVTDSDEANLVACLMANILSSTTKKLARVRHGDFDQYHDILRENAPHIDNIINPEIEVVKTIEGMLRVPGAADVGEFADGRILFIGVYLDKTSRLAGIKLSELPDKVTNARPLVAAVVREEELIIPRGNDRLMPGDLVYFICEKDKLQETLAVFDKHDLPANRVLIVGGGNIGLRLAKRLEEKANYCKIIEKDAARCALLAENLNKAVVLCGDRSDQDLLAEENIRDMDAVVTLTDDEETKHISNGGNVHPGVNKL
ncbi:NAD-binding protein, partial [Thermodesulfobacteriota bacterium]